MEVRTRSLIRIFLSSVALTVAVGGVSVSEAQAGWKIDDSHSAVNFSITHMMVTTVRGAFTGITGTIDLEAKKVDVTIDVASVDTRDKKRDDHLRGADFFDAGKYPTARFVSKKMSIKGSVVEVSGDLTLRGVTKSVTLKGTVSSELKNPWGKVVRGLQVKTKINREDFKVSWNKTLDKGGVILGKEVELEINIELIKE